MPESDDHPGYCPIHQWYHALWSCPHCDEEARVSNIYHKDNIPSVTAAALDAYVMEHRPVGDFLFAVLSNDLIGAYQRADVLNTVAMPAIVAYVRNSMPVQSYGTKDKVLAWLSNDAQTRGEHDHVSRTRNPTD